MTKSIFVLAVAAIAALGGSVPSPASSQSAPARAEESADLERLATGLRRPWCVAFVPGGELLITEKHTGVRAWRHGTLDANVLSGGPPNVFAEGDSGLLDIALDPDFAENRQVYVTFVEGTEKANRTAIWKARYDGARLTEGRVVFRVTPDKAEASHPGGRLLFLPDKTLLLTVGDGYNYRTAAQDLGSHLGKILRLARDGTAPPDNPFVGRAGVRPEIWTYGHRNPQGLARDPDSGVLWEHEHGPRGGDELNVLRAGANYGWPLVTHGIDYDGTLISERMSAPGLARPAFFWAPSIAPSGLAVYRGPFEGWRGKLFVGGLTLRSIVRLRRGTDSGLVFEDERMFAPMSMRIRDIREGPDGLLYVLTDEQDGVLLRLHPHTKAR